MSNTLDSELLEALLVIRQDKGLRWAGICQAIREIRHGHPREERTRAMVKRFLMLSREWDEYSGWPDYPVCSYTNGKNPREEYEAAACAGGMWSGDYGALREQLLDYVISRLEYRDLERSLQPE